MVDNAAISSGDWETAGGWSLGHAPLSTERAVIPSGVTIETKITDDCAGNVLVQSGGKLKLGAGIVLKVVQNIIVEPAGSLISLGGRGNPAVIDGYTSSQWILILTTPAADTNLDYLWLKNNLYYLGYGITNYTYFNDRVTRTRPWVTNIIPLSRQPIIISHNIDGRAYGRTYRRGSQAGTVTINGYYNLDTFDFIQMKNMQAANSPLCLTTDRVHLPCCSIDGEPRFDHKPGQTWGAFSIRLIEDR